MASAFIIFENRQHLALPNILAKLRDLIGFDCQEAEWRFGERVVAQIRVATVPPIALQLDEDPDIVPEEIQEMLDSDARYFEKSALTAARRCRSRVEVVSCEPTRVGRFPEGGTLTHSPNADMDSPDVQLAVRRIAAALQGWAYDNVNGRWL